MTLQYLGSVHSFKQLLLYWLLLVYWRLNIFKHSEELGVWDPNVAIRAQLLRQPANLSVQRVVPNVVMNTLDEVFLGDIAAVLRVMNPGGGRGIISNTWQYGLNRHY